MRIMPKIGYATKIWSCCERGDTRKSSKTLMNRTGDLESRNESATIFSTIDVNDVFLLAC